MAISILSNKWLEEKSKKNVDEETDTFFVILLDNTFSFNRVTHETYAHISSFELPTGNGYTQGGIALSGGALTRNDVADQMERDWIDLIWTAAGGSIGPMRWCGLIDDTHADDIIMGCADFEEDITVQDSSDFELRDILKISKTDNSGV